MVLKTNENGHLVKNHYRVTFGFTSGSESVQTVKCYDRWWAVNLTMANVARRQRASIKSITVEEIRE